MKCDTPYWEYRDIDISTFDIVPIELTFEIIEVF